MIDSGAAAHVCPTWFAPGTPLYQLQHGQGPKLTTATDEDIPVHGYKWVFMHNTHKQTLVVPFDVCDVTQPIMSVTRLAEQGFNTQLSETPAITHSKGFHSTLKQREGLYFLPVTLVALPVNMRLEANQTAEGTTARVAPVTLTPTGMEINRNKNDLWTFNIQGFLATEHNAKHFSCQIATVQFQQRGWRNTEARSYNDQTTTQRSLKKHTKTSTRSNRKGSSKDPTGAEKHGSE